MIQVLYLKNVKDRYSFQRKLGEGTYANVYLAKPKASAEGVPSAAEVALKRYKEVHVGEQGLAEGLLREACLLQRLVHPNLLKMHEMLHCGARVYLVIEYMPFTLEDVVDYRPLAECELRNVLRQLLQALVYCHGKEVIHRDISVGNVFIDRKQALEEAHVKLGDLNLARMLPDTGVPLTPGMVTVQYRAPELLCGVRQYGPAVDMWSVGCVAAEALRGDVLFDGDSEMFVLADILATLEAPAPEYLARLGAKRRNLKPRVRKAEALHEHRKLRQRLPECSDMAQELVCALLQYDPAHRPSAEQTLQLPFLTAA